MVSPLLQKLKNPFVSAPRPKPVVTRATPERTRLASPPPASRRPLVTRDVFVPAGGTIRRTDRPDLSGGSFAAAQPGLNTPGPLGTFGRDVFKPSGPLFRGPDLTGSGGVQAFTRTTGDGVEPDYSETVGRAWSDITSTGNGGPLLADYLRSDHLSVEEKRALIDYAIRSGNAGSILTDFQNGGEARNYDYDDLTVVAAAVADAHRAGVVTDEELADLAEQLGPEAAAQFAAQLALDPANTRAGGVVEAFGREAEALGHEQAAAVAYSSSPALIEAHLPTDAQQQAAFAHVQSYLEGTDRGDLSNEELALYTVVAGNAVRLSANGNGFSDSELNAFVEDLGPALAGEVVSRLRNVPGDASAGGAVESFGRAAQAVAEQTSDGDDKKAWELNAAIAFTASRELIDRNLQGDAALRAFELLSEAAEAGLEGAEEAQGEYALVRYPEILEGAGQLFEAHSAAIIDASLRGESGLDEQGLQDFIQIVGFSPHSSAAAKQQVQAAITAYAASHVQIGPEHNEGQLSFEVGQLLAITQNAADAAIARVGDDAAARTQAQNDARAFLVQLGSVLIQRGISSWNPLVGALAGPALREVLEQVLPQQDVDAARAAAERAYEAELARQGANPDLGQALKAAQEAYLRVLHDAILNQLQSGNLTQDQHNQLSVALDTLESMQLELDNGYSEQRPD